MSKDNLSVKYRHAIITLFKLLLCALVVASFVYCVVINYPETDFHFWGYVMFAVLYLIVFLATANMYHCLNIGTLRKRELLFSFLFSTLSFTAFTPSEPGTALWAYLHRLCLFILPTIFEVAALSSHFTDGETESVGSETVCLRSYSQDRPKPGFECGSQFPKPLLLPIALSRSLSSIPTSTCPLCSNLLLASA